MNINPAVFLTDDDMIEEFLDLVYAADPIFSVDLIAANPDVRSQLGRGGAFFVNVVQVAFQDNEYFVTFSDEDDGDPIDLSSPSISLHERRSNARDAADEMILTWKRNWGINLI